MEKFQPGSTAGKFGDAPVSKMLVLDNCPSGIETIKRFCMDNSLVGLKVRKNRLLSVLRTNIDLGAIVLAEDYGDTPEESFEIALRIHTLRPELPIILRRGDPGGLDSLPESIRRIFCVAYTNDDIEPLRSAIDGYIFSLKYPNALVRGILEISETMLSSTFKNADISWEAPCIVRDRIIFGEVFSLIPLESDWCRGYMMMKAEEEPVLEMMQLHQMVPEAGKADFRDLNSLMSELTNLIWGAFKNRFIGSVSGAAHPQVQVPLIVNHKQKYISFGTENPQLSFIYKLTEGSTGKTVKLHQRFIFNLNWSPEDFRENMEEVGALVESGELELF